MGRQRRGIEFVNDFEPRFLAAIIDAANVEQVIELQLVAAKRGDLPQVRRQNAEGCFAAKLDSALQPVAQHFLKRRRNVGARHAVPGSNRSACFRFWSRNEVSVVIFSWSFMRPSSSASGRG